MTAQLFASLCDELEGHGVLFNDTLARGFSIDEHGIHIGKGMEFIWIVDPDRSLPFEILPRL